MTWSAKRMWQKWWSGTSPMWLGHLRSLVFSTWTSWNSAAMLWGNPSSPVERSTRRQTKTQSWQPQLSSQLTASINLPALWVNHFRGGSCSPSGAASVDAMWGRDRLSPCSNCRLVSKTNECCYFKSVSSGVVCHIAMDKWNTVGMSSSSLRACVGS